MVAGTALLLRLGGFYDDNLLVIHGMFKSFIRWLKGNPPPSVEPSTQQRRRVSAHNAIRPRPVRQRETSGRKQAFDPYQAADGGVDSTAPIENLHIRNKYVREEAGTHETLQILDDSMLDSGEESGIDPYNSGEFDRSKNWDVRFRS